MSDLSVPRRVMIFFSHRNMKRIASLPTMAMAMAIASLIPKLTSVLTRWLIVSSDNNALNVLTSPFETCSVTDEIDFTVSSSFASGMTAGAACNNRENNVATSQILYIGELQILNETVVEIVTLFENLRRSAPIVFSFYKRIYPKAHHSKDSL